MSVKKELTDLILKNGVVDRIVAEITKDLADAVKRGDDPNRRSKWYYSPHETRRERYVLFGILDIRNEAVLAKLGLIEYPGSGGVAVNYYLTEKGIRYGRRVLRERKARNSR